jgi:mono/diheme cytochrome c family protein
MLRRVTLLFVVVLLFPAGSLEFAAFAAVSPAKPDFALPAGDAVKGRAVFLKMECNHCHMVTGRLAEGIARPVTATPAPLLNSDVAKKGQAALVTSVINPSHVISGTVSQREGKLSPMGDYTRAMTVRDLVDLVSFLQSIEETNAPIVAKRR